MLSLFDASKKTLSEDSIQKILELLKISLDPNTIIEFLYNPEEEKLFYYFFFDVLIGNDTKCAIDIDHKWLPEDLFGQLERYFTADVITLQSSEQVSDKLYRIEYGINGKSETVLASTSDPDWLLDNIARHLRSEQFIAINFLEDRYSWLIVPKSFDIETFCYYTGLSAESVKREQKAPKNFAKKYKQSEKLFFRPTIIYVDKNQIGYDMPGQVWAGRVLPGQTIKEGIATELKAELNYSGRFDYLYDNFEGTFKDRKGRDVKRYNLIVYLFDKTFQSKMAGKADIRLKQIPNKTFHHPDSS